MTVSAQIAIYPLRQERLTPAVERLDAHCVITDYRPNRGR